MLTCGGPAKQLVPKDLCAPVSPPTLPWSHEHKDSCDTCTQAAVKCPGASAPAADTSPQPQPAAQASSLWPLCEAARPTGREAVGFP